MKICNSCEAELDESEFYPKCNKCKECVKLKVKEYRKNNSEKIKSFDRERGLTDKRKKANRDYQNKIKADNPEEWAKRRKKTYKKYSDNNREKRNAEQKLARAMIKGLVLKSPCFICGNDLSEAHHPNYSKPLEVVWLCDFHHKEEHKKLREIDRELTASSS